MIRSVPTILPEGNEITRRKSKPERQRLITEEGTGLEFPGGGCLGGCFIELGEAGWSQPRSTWKGIQGRKSSSELQEKVPGSFLATSTSPKSWENRDSVKAEQEQRPIVVMLGPEHFP